VVVTVVTLYVVLIGIARSDLWDAMNTSHHGQIRYIYIFGIWKVLVHNRTNHDVGPEDVDYDSRDGLGRQFWVVCSVVAP
jgi:hypothetical protein